jgi:hypothetical protein
MAVFDEPVTVRGAFSAESITLPNNSVRDSNVDATSPLTRTKSWHQTHKSGHQAPGTAVVAQTIDVYIARAAAVLVSFEAAITGALADDASRHVTVDLQKSTGGGAFATMLSGVIDLTSSSTLRTAVAAALSSSALVDGDILRVIVAVSGGAGNQAQGLVFEATIAESPD